MDISEPEINYLTVYKCSKFLFMIVVPLYATKEAKNLFFRKTGSKILNRKSDLGTFWLDLNDLGSLTFIKKPNGDRSYQKNIPTVIAIKNIDLVTLKFFIFWRIFSPKFYQAYIIRCVFESWLFFINTLLYLSSPYLEKNVKNHKAKFWFFVIMVFRHFLDSATR